VRFDEQLNEIEVKRESDNRHFMKIKSEIQQKENCVPVFRGVRIVNFVQLHILTYTLCN